MNLPIITDRRNHGLDMLRGVCAVAVAAYHFLNWSYDVTLLSMGTFGVYTFFVLSALTMSQRYRREFSGVISFEAATVFYRNRAIRILPLLALVATFGLVYNHLRLGSSLSGNFANAFLTGTGLMALHIPGMISKTVGAWSLGIELLFYALFPVIALLVAGSSTRKLLACLLVLVFAQQMLLGILPDSTDPNFWHQYIMPLTFAPFFAAGLLINRLPLPSSRWAGLSATASILAVFGFSLVVQESVYDPGWVHLTLTALAVMAVAFANSAQIHARLVPIAAFLGGISYSLYLSHWLAYDLAKTFAPNFLLPAFVALTITIATALTYGFERPIRQALLVRNIDRSGVEGRGATDSREPHSVKNPG